MTSFAALFERTGEPVDERLAGCIVQAMSHRGLDGSSIHCAGSIGLGAQMFWTTPEDTGVSQPLTVEGSRAWIVFDGRIDNRQELLACLRISGRHAASVSDPELALRAYMAWGDSFVEHLLGPCAFAIADPGEQSVLLGRDALGSRTLYYHVDDRRLVVASEEHAILRHHALRPALNELTLARYFTIRGPQQGDTFFEAICELPPATCMRVTRTRKTTWQHWQPAPARIRYRTDGEYAEHYRELLSESIRCRMRATSPPAVQMSGGLDSTSVAALASRLHVASPQSQRLNAISYVFDQIPSIDESARIDAMAAALPLNSLRFNGDDCWPRNGLETWPQNPNRPDVNMYRLLAQSSYRLAHLSGTRVLFSGAESDNHFTGATEWLYELLQDCKLSTAAAECLRVLSRREWHHAEPLFLYLSLRRVAGHMLSPIRTPAQPVVYRTQEYPWLTAKSLTLLNDAREPAATGGHNRQLQFQGIFTSGTKWLMTAERYFAMLERVEVRRPYFDRRLVEFMLAIPAYQLYNRGYLKYILREAMRGALPDAVRAQKRRTAYTPLFQIGMDRDRRRLAAVVAKPDALWARYIRPEWLVSIPPEYRNITRKTRRGYLLGDWCVAFDAWIGCLDNVGVR